MVHWVRDDQLVVDGTTYCLMGFEGKRPPGAFQLLKSRALVEEYLCRAPEFRHARVMEVGIFRGGSIALLASILDPEKLIGVDVSERRVELLDRWLNDRGYGDRVRLHYGVDQSDHSTLADLVVEEYGGAPLDLVIDDASHRLTPTSRTFNALFPRLRPGGLYILEDWNAGLAWRRKWAAQAARSGANLDPVDADVAHTAEPSAASTSTKGEMEMWRLLLRIVLALGAHQDLIPEVNLAPSFAAIRRGPEPLDPATFDLDDWLLALRT